MADDKDEKKPGNGGFDTEKVLKRAREEEQKRLEEAARQEQERRDREKRQREK